MREDWEIKKLVELFDVKSSKRVHKADWKTEGVPFYRAREVVKLAQNGIVDNDLFISEELYKEFTKEKGAPKEGDIIISAVGTLGQCYLVKKTDRFYFKDASVLWFENISNVDVRYIEYAFKSDLIMKQVLNKSMGATVGTLTISRAKIIQIPIPPLEEQKQIVALLDKAFTAIDQAKANIEKNIENTKELFQSKLNDIFSQKGDSWEEKLLPDIVSSTCSLSYGIVQPGNEYPDGLPVIRPTDMKVKYVNIGNLKRIDPIKADSYKRTTLTGNELLLCVRGDTGVISIATEELKGANVTRGIVPILFDEDLIRLNFAYFQFISEFLYKQIKEKTYGAALMQINIRDVRQLKLNVPPTKVQDELLPKLNALSDNIESILSSYSNKLTSLEDLKKSILQKAFTGELTQKAVEV